MKRINLFLALAVCALLFSCKSQTSVGSFVTFDTECLQPELDGSATLRAWGEGRNKADAVEQAKKNAVRDIIFKGITKGRVEYNLRPLVFEVNAQEKYQEYFNIFFMDGGEYKKYVSSEDEKNHSKVSEKNQIGSKYAVTVRVLRAELQKRLKTDGIIK